MAIPRIVAIGMVFEDCFTLSDGMVADSRPRNAHSVNEAVADIALKLDSPLKLNGMKCAVLKFRNPNIPNIISGRILMMVVMSCTIPTFLMLLVLMNVKSQIAPTATIAESRRQKENPRSGHIPYHERSAQPQPYLLLLFDSFGMTHRINISIKIKKENY